VCTDVFGERVWARLRDACGGSLLIILEPQSGCVGWSVGGGLLAHALTAVHGGELCYTTPAVPRGRASPDQQLHGGEPSRTSGDGKALGHQPAGHSHRQPWPATATATASTIHGQSHSQPLPGRGRHPHDLPKSMAVHKVLRYS
jgi:hypothetical protein